MNKVLKVIAVLICPVLLCSCATIISGTSQNLTVNTSPSEAIITVNGMSQQSPAVFTLNKQTSIYYVKIEKKGYKPVNLTITRGVSGWVFGNIVFGGIIGIVVDCATGSIYKFSPTEISQNLVPEGEDALQITVK